MPQLYCRLLKGGSKVKYRHVNTLEEKHKDHQLKGKMSKYRKCHIQPDWLLVYLIEEDILVLTLVDTGTHSDLFGE
ncbi:type II toxin-antitoxin system YafQ family toxin [Acetatifactor muris]|uniref:type II toxin-antitoxin system YafQ family toxin n=1 Tax=Acetatifactor muris TaxID=879566 RepID=UPI000CD20220|nr:type II toxin-antitoxin system YafQ family toxin [Acetatifactor muris]